MYHVCAVTHANHMQTHGHEVIYAWTHARRQVLGNALGLKHKHEGLTCGRSYLAVTIMTVISTCVLGCVKGVNIQHVRRGKKNQIVLCKETL